MPYKKSKSRVEFEKTSQHLISLAKIISYKKNTLSYAHKNLIYQSTIVLLSSTLEEYQRIFIEDLFFSYRFNMASLDQIPSMPRTFSLFSKQKVIYESFIHNRDESKTLNKLDISNGNLYSVLNNASTYTNHIDSKMIVNDKKYPSPKNMKILFNRIGLKNVFTELNKRGKKDYELILRSFLDIRETIAHQESTNLTFDDVSRNFINISDLIDKIDRTLYTHICKSSGMKFWN